MRDHILHGNPSPMVTDSTWLEMALEIAPKGEGYVVVVVVGEEGEGGGAGGRSGGNIMQSRSRAPPRSHRRKKMAGRDVYFAARRERESRRDVGNLGSLVRLTIKVAMFC